MNEQVKEGRKEAKFKCGCLVINKPQSLGNWLMHKYYFCGVQYNSTAQLSKIISNYIYTPASISWIFETGKIKSVNSENCAHKSNSSAYKNYLGRSKNVHSQTPLCQWYIQVKWTPDGESGDLESILFLERLHESGQDISLLCASLHEQYEKNSLN